MKYRSRNDTQLVFLIPPAFPIFSPRIAIADMHLTKCQTQSDRACLILLVSSRFWFLFYNSGLCRPNDLCVAAVYVDACKL